MLKKIKIFFLLTISIFIVCVAFFFFSAAKMTIKDGKLYSIVGGAVQKYAGKITLTHSDDATRLDSAANKFTLDSSPLFFEQQKKMLLPQSMAIVLYNQSKKMFKLNYFASIVQSDGRLNIEDKSYTTQRSNFFLFDGNDTYVFFEPTTITFGEQKIVLPPFSYVTSIYNNKLSVFNFDSSVYNEFPIKGLKVVASLEYSNAIDLNTDTLLSGNNDQVLLIKQIQDLKNLE